MPQHELPQLPVETLALKWLPPSIAPSAAPAGPHDPLPERAAHGPMARTPCWLMLVMSYTVLHSGPPGMSAIPPWAVYACRTATPVDVLFTHIPPAIPELVYDVEARRFEVGSAALLHYVHEHQPRYHVFGHVHQPLVPRMRIGRTECVNVGHFAGTGRPYVLDLA